MSKSGMGYEEGRARVSRMVNTSKGHPQAKANYVNSVLNQVRIREGAGAVREIQREFSRSR